MKIYIILGSTRKNRASEKVGKWVLENIPKEKDVTFELIDLRNFPLPFFDHLQRFYHDKFDDTLFFNVVS